MNKIEITVPQYLFKMTKIWKFIRITELRFIKGIFLKFKRK